VKKRTKVTLWVIGIIVVVCIILGVVAFRQIEKNLEELSTLSIGRVDLASVRDGTYEGGYKVFPVTVRVRVTVEDHRISDIQILEHIQGQGKSAEAITGEVIRKQSLQVDIISGATYSSKVILKAIEAALTGS
jgi:uncharacterized protein with FMN-binding domain